ncbi:MAG: hypothetical protein CL583_00160 [Alteromonadaceae bacterium]|nr:hypothetical protein [Alteromonadaceae bacterium]
MLTCLTRFPARMFLPFFLRLSFLVTTAVSVPVHSAVGAGGGLEFPGAGIVERQPITAEDEIRIYTSKVSEVGDRLRYNDALDVEGVGQKVLLSAPSDVSPAAVYEHYRAAILEREGRILFSCEGRACGRSAVWANRVFQQSRVYGQDGEQAYLVGAWRDEQNRLQLLATYIVRRGNRTVSILEQHLTLPETYRLPGANPRERRLLGPFVIPVEVGAIPRLSLAPETGEDLQRIASRYPEAAIYVTAFVPADVRGPAEAMSQAQLAVQAATGLLENQGIPAERQHGIAVGAAVPIAEAGRQGPRIEVTIIRPRTAGDE